MDKYSGICKTVGRTIRLVIVPFSAFENPKTSAVSLLCLTAGAGTALLFSMLGEM